MAVGTNLAAFAASYAGAKAAAARYGLGSDLRIRLDPAVGRGLRRSRCIAAAQDRTDFTGITDWAMMAPQSYNYGTIGARPALVGRTIETRSKLFYPRIPRQNRFGRLSIIEDIGTSICPRFL